MRPCPPTLRRRVATALLSLVTLAGAGTLSAQADNGDNNGQNISDLVIKKSITEISDNKITYSIEVTNKGPRPGTQVRIKDQLDDALTAESAAVTKGALPSDGCVISNDGHTVDCDIHGQINPTDPPRPPQNGRPKVVVVLVATITGVGEVCNTATVTGNHQDPNGSNNTDPDESNNTSKVCTTITQPPTPPEADLSIVKHVDKDVAMIGEDVLYTLKVHNDGPDAATDVTVEDAIPAQATIQEITPSQPATCTPAMLPATGTVKCNLGFMASKSNATVKIRVRATVKKLTVENKATVSADQIDLVPSNNTSNTVTTAFVAFVKSGAYGELIGVKTILGVQVKSGPLASVTLPEGGGGPFTDSAVKINVTGGLLLKDLVRLDLLKATTEGGKNASGDVYVKSSADVASASLVNGLIKVQGLHSECYASSASMGHSSANVAKLWVAGVEVKVAAGPNSKVYVPGVGELILNEQATTLNDGLLNQAGYVNALHLKLDGLLAKGDIILAHSECGIDP